MMVRAAALIGGLLLPAAGAAADWTLVTTSTTGTRIEVDSASIVGPPEAPKAWFRFTYSKPRDGHAMAKSRYHANCDDQRLRFLSGADYDATDQVVQMYPPGSWFDAMPESTGEEMLAAICYRR